jgi:hypothetical protein
MSDSRQEDKKTRHPSSTATHSDAGRKSPATTSGSARKDSVYTQDELDIPAIEVPKGGGALKSIDEKFQVNAANGTVSFSVPLPLSKTRGDFAPALSLGYNSGGGNGVFGLGWSLTHATIQRRTDKRLPEYEDSSESDVYVLSGTEDMVPALVQDGGGNWVLDEFVAATGEAVKRYRPRIEGAFSRIERITLPGAFTFYWKITVYGRSAGARLADPSAPGRVFAWLPELSTTTRVTASSIHMCRKTSRTFPTPCTKETA